MSAIDGMTLNLRNGLEEMYYHPMRFWSARAEVAKKRRELCFKRAGQAKTDALRSFWEMQGKKAATKEEYCMSRVRKGPTTGMSGTEIERKIRHIVEKWRAKVF